jgi:hypothetical protein
MDRHANSLPVELHYPRWFSPILCWFHATMAGLAFDSDERDRHVLLAAQHRLRAESGLWVTDHAVDRFMERYGPYADRFEAKAELLLIAGGAIRMGDAPHDAERWLGHRGVVLVVRDGSIVTVLPREEVAA